MIDEVLLCLCRLQRTWSVSFPKLERWSTCAWQGKAMVWPAALTWNWLTSALWPPAWATMGSILTVEPSRELSLGSLTVGSVLTVEPSRELSLGLLTVGSVLMVESSRELSLGLLTMHRPACELTTELACQFGTTAEPWSLVSVVCLATTKSSCECCLYMFC